MSPYDSVYFPVALFAAAVVFAGVALLAFVRLSRLYEGVRKHPYLQVFWRILIFGFLFVVIIGAGLELAFPIPPEVWTGKISLVTMELVKRVPIGKPDSPKTYPDLMRLIVGGGLSVKEQSCVPEALVEIYTEAIHAGDTGVIEAVRWSDIPEVRQKIHSDTRLVQKEKSDLEISVQPEPVLVTNESGAKCVRLNVTLINHSKGKFEYMMFPPADGIFICAVNPQNYCNFVYPFDPSSPLTGVINSVMDIPLEPGASRLCKIDVPLSRFPRNVKQYIATVGTVSFPYGGLISAPFTVAF